jgi:Tol biopolymer transport system component/DNA-binding winged helix-turn-helix (wHTH) protein
MRKIYEFGPFRMDPAQKILLRDGQIVPLTLKTLDLLRALLENQGQVLEKDVLLKTVWPDTFVEEGNLTKGIFRLRKALGDGYIETLPKRGYRFVGEMRILPSTAITTDNPVGPFRRPYRKIALGFASILAIGAAALLLSRANVKPKTIPPSEYVQLTNFTDPVTAPALSPDGRMLAFLRDDQPFLGRGQLYVKRLPDGEPVQLTSDPRPKYGPIFSPDGSHLAFTMTEPKRGQWNTWTVAVTGGQPQLFLANAAGLTWIGGGRLLFSEIKTGMHMGVVTTTESRSDLHDVYLPEHERAMAHYSYASPDRKWALIVEMDRTATWQPCRLVPLDGGSKGRQAGPSGECRSAAWSPDRRWMYFSAFVDGSSHLWRQRFPDGAPEQITFGPTEEDGVAVSPDGRSLISSVGLRQSAIFLRDSHGERSISSEGYATHPAFSADGKSVYYLLRRESLRAPKELWRAQLSTGRNDRLLPGFSIDSYQISPDGSEIIFETRPEGGKPQIWLASLEQRFPPRSLLSSGEDSPGFAPGDALVFRSSEGAANYLYRITRDGSGREKVAPDAISTVFSMSPDGRWVGALAPAHEDGLTTQTLAIPTQGGAPRRVCPGFCEPLWSPDGRFFFILFEHPGVGALGKTLAVPLRPGEALPELPPAGIAAAENGLVLPGARVFERGLAAPGPDLTAFAYAKTSMYHNLFRIPLP